jgi:hypothetical protein
MVQVCAEFGYELSAARQFYADCASRTGTDAGHALKHAVLCLSAQHRANKSRIGGDTAISADQASTSTKHRSKALHFLRIAAAKDAPATHTDSLAAAMVLLILSTVWAVKSHLLTA